MLIKPFSFLQQKVVGGGGLPAINTTGLLVWLDANFPGGTPSTTWADNSGNGNDFTVTSAGTGTNPSLTTTLDEAYYQLTGVYSSPGVSTTQTGGGYFTMATTPLTSTSLTFTVWLYPDLNYSTSQTVGRWVSGGGSGGRLFYGSGFGSTNFGWGSSTYTPAPMQHPTQSAWQEFTVTFTPSTTNGVQHYYNGSQYAQANTSAIGSIVAGKPMHIGKQFDNLTEYFSGRLAIVLVYDRVLSAAEVLANHNAVSVRYNY